MKKGSVGSMITSRHIKTFMLVFAILAGINLAAFFLATHADSAQTHAYEERHALSSATFEFNLASISLTRWMRVVAVTGGETQYDAFWAEIERDRPGQSLNTFLAFNAPPDEIALMEELIERRNQMNGLAAEVLRLRTAGYYEKAIDLAHGQEITDLGTPFTATFAALNTLVQSRTQAMLDYAQLRFDLFESLVVTTVILLFLMGLLGLFWVIRVKTSRPLKALVAVFLLMAAANVVFLMFTLRLNDEKSTAYELRESLVSTIYGIETSTETLTRLMRAFIITGCETYYDTYRENLQHDTFRRALETFLILRAPDHEVNMLVELVGMMHALRQNEAQAIASRQVGYYSEAIDLAFGPNAAAVGIPALILSNDIREKVTSRSQETVDTVLHSFSIFHALLLTATLLLIITGFTGLFAKLRELKLYSSTGEAASEPSYIIKRIKGLSIAARFVISFVLIIVFFSIHVAITYYFNSAIGELNRHNIDFMSARAETALVYHQEFTEMRRLLGESFMNPQWLEDANIGIRHSFEQMLNASYAHMSYLADFYINLVRSDHIFPEMPYDSRIYAMTEVMTHTSMIYETFRENFFLSGNMSYYHGDVLDYTSIAEIMLQLLRQIVGINQSIVSANIERYQNMTNAVSIVSLVTVIALASYLAYLTVKNFTVRIKAIEANAALVKQGIFDSFRPHAENDEMSIIFLNLTKAFTSLISAINETSLENAKGNTLIRINSESFQGEFQKAALAVNALLDTVKLGTEKEIEAEKTREIEKRLQLMLDATPMAMFMFDPTLTAIACNQESVRMFGASSKAHFLDGNNSFAPLHQPNGEKSKNLFKSYLAKAFEEGFCHVAHYVCEKADGTFFPAEITIVRVEYKGGHAVVEYIRDLTDINAALEKERQAEEESRAKTRFLARMSHEIRTPMNAVLSIAELQLQNTEHPPNTEEAFLRIHNSSNLLLAILNDILDFAKIESDKIEIVPAVYEIASILVDTVQLNIMHIGSKQIEFKLEVDDKLPTHLIGDELRIKQILNNLLSNAFKYTQEGQITLSFNIEPAEPPDEINIVIRVTDTGQGMTEDQIAHLFETEFTRFNMQSNRYIEGSGLGMMIAHRIVTIMRGSIAVNSELGEGSTFTVTIPQKPKGSDVLGKEAASNLQNIEVLQQSLKKVATLTRVPMPHGRVLVVDDVESNLYVVKASLIPYKINVETISNGHDAIQKVKAGEVYDIIFMDHMMPGIDGLEATKTIRKMGYRHPIVALTANAVKGVSEMFLNSGFDDFISKPIALNELDACLIRYISDKQPPETSAFTKEQHTETKKPSHLTKLFELFLRDAVKALGILETLAVAQELDDAALKSYTTQVHAMKSALLNIGHTELSQFASTLEEAGQLGDIDTVRAQTPQFLDKLREIMTNPPAS